MFEHTVYPMPSMTSHSANSIWNIQRLHHIYCTYRFRFTLTISVNFLFFLISTRSHHFLHNNNKTQWNRSNVLICTDRQQLEMAVRLLSARYQHANGHGVHHLFAVARYILEVYQCVGRTAATLQNRIPGIFSWNIYERCAGAGLMS